MSTHTEIPPTLSPPEIWGGIECSINRIGNKFYDQFHYAGLASQPAYLELIASLGIKALRLPVLWERHQKDLNDRYYWTNVAEQRSFLRKSKIRPIVGLVHHGSGPEFTSLEDPEFASHVAKYARAFASAFPEVKDYTIINEPLTTARF